MRFTHPYRLAWAAAGLLRASTARRSTTGVQTEAALAARAGQDAQGALGASCATDAHRDDPEAAPSARGGLDRISMRT
jgi:hypothetical protein